jgi:hypothetical protein
MSTQNALITRAHREGPRARAVTVALLAAGALAAGALAGCGTVQAGSPSGAAAPTASSTASAASSASSGSAASGGPAAPTAPAASASAAPVQTVSGGPVTPGEPACAGWPSGPQTGAVPASFVPVAVERCVNGAQTIPGKGLWLTATLQRADSGLAALVSALHQPPGTRRPGIACPQIAVIAQAIVLISATGQELIPRLPVSGCGLVQSKVLAALKTLPWRVVSVRLISPIPGASASATAS